MIKIILAVVIFIAIDKILGSGSDDFLREEVRDEKDRT